MNTNSGERVSMNHWTQVTGFFGGSGQSIVVVADRSTKVESGVSFRDTPLCARYCWRRQPLLNRLVRLVSRLLLLAGVSFLLVSPIAAANLALSITTLTTENLPDLDAEITVRDEGDRPFSGLSSEEVKVFIDGQRVENYSVTPIRRNQDSRRIIFLLEKSARMKGDSFFRARSVIRLIVQRLAPTDMYALLTFSDRVEIVQDLTEEKFRANRQLSQLSLEPGSMTDAQAVKHLFMYLPKAGLNHACLVIVTSGDAEQGHEDVSTVSPRIAESNIEIVGISVNESPDGLDTLGELVGLLGGKAFYFQKPSDVWTIFRHIDRNADGLYRIHVEQAHPKDFAIHSLKVVLEVYGITASDDAGYIGAPGEGINPKDMQQRYFLRTSWTAFFFIALGAFLATVVLLSVEKYIPIKLFGWKTYPLVAAVGGLCGFLFSRLLFLIPG
jgi:hypothetical protein